MNRFHFASLSEEQKLLELRILEVILARHGQVASVVSQIIPARLDSHYPASSWPLNRELCRLLLFLEAPEVVPRTIDLLSSAPSLEQQFHYVAQLRNARNGWTLPARRAYFSWWLQSREGLPRPPELERWFQDVGRQPVDGAWVDRYLREFRADAVGHLTPDERRVLADVIETPFQKARLVPAVGRGFVRDWTMADLAPDLPQVAAGRNFNRGRQAFVDAQCLACHRFGNDGGSVGPELSGAGSKYDARSLLESILEPSKVLSEQYQNVTVFLKNDDAFTGRLVRENSEQVVIETDPLSGTRETIARKDVDRIAPSQLSPMPEGLANVLGRDEILDLIAYLQSGGRADAVAFQNR